MCAAINIFCSPSPELTEVEGLILSLTSTAPAAATLDWIWPTDPDTEWVVESSADGVTGWTAAAEFNANLRTADVLLASGIYLRLYGYNPDTGYSNIVFLP